MKTATSSKKRKGIFAYIREVVAELNKVNWPTREEAMRLSLIVLVICIVMGAIMGGLDYGFTELVDKVFLGGT